MHLPTIALEKSNPDASRLALKAMVIESQINAHHLSRNNVPVYRNNRWIWDRDLARLQGTLDFYLECLKTSHNF